MKKIAAGAISVVLYACLSTAAFAVDFGRTTGSFGVSSGSASYSIPIWTPPGPNGLQPSISLNYDSQADNGVGGVGWNLAAVGAISRCPRTWGQDGAREAVDLSMNDRYCISGNRLRVVSGTYGAANSVYYTEIADYSRITAFGTQGNGPQYFIVEAKNGLKYEYGNSSTSRVLLGTTVLRWMLNKVSDRNGNNYIITYNSNVAGLIGFALPDVISWTPTSLNVSTYRYEAKFNYWTGRSDADSYIGKVANNFDVSNRYRLSNIQIKSAGVVKRKYVFDYGGVVSPTTSRSRLLTAKECADDAESNCLLPLTFGYQDGVAGVAAGAGSAPAGSSNGLYAGRYDLNGDGKNDIAYKNGTTWYVAFGSNSGFSSPYSVGITAGVVIDKFLPNGRDSMLALIGGTLWSYRWDDATSAFVGYNTGVASTIIGLPFDYNGDGLADLIYKNTTGLNFQLRANTSSSSSSNPSFATTVVATATVPAGYKYAGAIAYPGKGLSHSDINGDGRDDLNVLMIKQDETSQLVSFMALGSSSGFTVPPSSSWQFDGYVDWPSINFNGDACTDRVNGATINISACNGQFASTVVLPATPVQFMDWDGDGKTDFLVDNGGLFGVYKSTGTGISSLITTSISSAGTFFDADVDGDHLDDLVKINGTAPFSYWTHTSSGAVPTYATNVPDLLTSVVDGFGVTNSPSYVSTASFQYTNGAATPYPLQEANSAIVVAQVTNSDGIGTTYSTTYSYSGARVNALRGTYAGFQRIDSSDSLTGLIHRQYFEQQFPVAGMVSQLEVMQVNGATPISRQVNSNSFVLIDNSSNNQRYSAFPSGSISTQYEFGGVWNGNLLGTATTSNTFDSATGTLYDQTVTTVEPASGANGLTAGASWIERTYAPLANLFTDTDNGNWCLGRPGQIQRTNSHNLSYGTALTRTTTTRWNGTYCRPTQVQEEPGNATLQVTTDIGYDSFGNVDSTTVTGIGMLPRTSKLVYADTTFTTGQFPLTTTNALSQSSTIAWDYDRAVPTSATDPNGLAISWLYDAFARRTRETRPDSTATTWTFNNCSAVSGGCVGPLNRMVIIETALSSLGTFINDQWSYVDQFDRPIIAKTRVLTGSYNRIDREFDAIGRLSRQSAPCFWTSCTQYWTTNHYDLIDRITSVDRPKSDSDSTLQSTTISYEGLTTRTTDAQSKQTFQVANAAGQLRQSKDHDGYYQTFEYDAFGNPKAVTDTAGNTLQSSVYNLRGMLTQRTDMDMGTWNFTPDALGQVGSQTDAKGQTTTFVFDLLGRLKTRTEAEGTSTWTWGTSAVDKNIGSLASVSGPGYSETFTYTALGTLVTRAIVANSFNYSINYARNSIGKLDNMTYPTSTSSYRLKLKFDYQNGELYRVRDFNNLATVFWTATGVNARDEITQETLGNGLVTNRAADAVTGLLKSVQTGPGGGSAVQNLDYEWDLVGNLKKRKDINQSSLTEEFFYDNLHRLDYSTLNAVQNLDMGYDALGNITSKSDVGTYTYHATKKHQLSSTSNGWSFSYDNNGNMTSGRGTTMTWTSYNYPASITNAGLTSTFAYTPDRQYYRQVADFSNGTATTVYIGGILEKVTTSAGTDHRHMIRVGGTTIIVSRQSSGTNTVNYVTSDQMGSASAITNSTGGVLVNSSFGAFGARRGSSWSGSPSAGDWTAIASTTRRGYTDHSMLDNVNFIHMNGRIYDPLVGRMMSADPTIPGDSTQAFNRYSYVINNPLSLTDPSGFAPGATDHRRQYEDGDSGLWGTSEVARDVALSHWAATWAGEASVWDYSGMGWFQLQHMQGFSGVRAPLTPQTWSSRGHEASIELMDGTVVMRGETSGSPVSQFADLSSLGASRRMPHGLRPSRFDGAVCDQAGCSLLDGTYYPTEGIEETSWLTPVFMALGVGLEQTGECTPDECQLAGVLIGAVLTRKGVPAARAGAQSFRSFSSLKNALGSAGPGKHWHHIVEQTPGNVARFGPEAVHNTQNVMRLDAAVHGRISAFYSSIQPFTGGQTVRQWLSGQSLQQQTQFGLETLQRFGVGP